MNTSVEPHQQVTRRDTRLLLRKFSMSSLICSARSYLFLPFLTYVPSSFFTYSRSNAAFIGVIPERNGLTFSRSCALSTPALLAAWYALSLKMSQPPNTSSSRCLNGTNFLINGERASVRLPSRIVLNCVSEPTGCAFPFLTSSTPAMNVVLTAPIPGKSTPNLPLGGAIFPGFSIPLLLECESHCHSPCRLDFCHYEQTEPIQLGLALALRCRASCTEQASNDARTPLVLQIIDPETNATSLGRGAAPVEGRFLPALRLLRRSFLDMSVDMDHASPLY